MMDRHTNLELRRGGRVAAKGVEDVVLERPEGGVALGLLGVVLLDGDVHDAARGRAGREQHRRELDQVRALAEQNLCWVRHIRSSQQHAGTDRHAGVWDARRQTRRRAAGGERTCAPSLPTVNMKLSFVVAIVRGCMRAGYMRPECTHAGC
jgi:hypothetical protein